MKSNKEKNFVALQLPNILKNRILAISFKRKMANEPNHTQAKVMIELIERGLSMVEPQTLDKV